MNFDNIVRAAFYDELEKIADLNVEIKKILDKARTAFGPEKFERKFKPITQSGEKINRLVLQKGQNGPRNF